MCTRRWGGFRPADHTRFQAHSTWKAEPDPKSDAGAYSGLFFFPAACRIVFRAQSPRDHSSYMLI